MFNNNFLLLLLPLSIYSRNCINYQSTTRNINVICIANREKYIGLERIAEELMGRRKWKQYQESLTQSHATDLLVKQSPSIGKFLK